MAVALGCAGESLGEVVEVVGVGGLPLDLVEHRQEIVEGVDGLKGRGVEWPGDPACGGDQERGADALGGCVGAIEVLGEAPVGGPGAASGPRGVAVEVEDEPDVAVLGGGAHGVVRAEEEEPRHEPETAPGSGAGGAPRGRRAGGDLRRPWLRDAAVKSRNSCEE
jgi:hypothetical protein